MTSNRLLIRVFGAALVSAGAAAFDPASGAPITITAEEEGAVLRAVHASYGAEILNPGVKRILSIRQAQGNVTATVYFEPHSSDGRRTTARMVFCRQGATLEEWNCVYTWEETRIIVPGQREPVQITDAFDDEVVDAVIAYVRGLPDELLRPVHRSDMDVISAVHFAPSGHVATMRAVSLDGRNAMVDVALCDPADFAQALARATFRHPGARHVCGMRDELVPRTASDGVRLTEDGMAMPADGSYVLVHHERGYAALRVFDIREVEGRDPARPSYAAQVEALYSDDGDFEAAQTITTTMTNDDAQDYGPTDVPGIRLDWRPSQAWLNLDDADAIVAVAITPWQDRRALDARSSALDWYYLRQAAGTREWSARHLPFMRLMTCQPPGAAPEPGR